MASHSLLCEEKAMGQARKANTTRKDPNPHGLVNMMSLSWLAPCACGPGSDLCQITATADRDQSSTREPIDLGKGSKLFKWHDHPLEITGGDK